MAAGTEGFNDTSQPGKDHIGAMISKVIAARKFAREEREAAEEKAKKAGYDSLDELGVEKGFFFKAALKSKFGGSYISGKKQDIQQTVDRVKLLKNPKAQFWNFVDNRGADGKEIKKLSEVERFREQFDNYAFVSAKRPPEKVESSEEMIPDTAEETASSASGTGKSRVSREDILTAVSAIASSLEQTAQSINNTLGETKDIASGVQAIKTDVVTQLSERTDTIEAKLDAIAAAINAQTALQKQTTDNNQAAQNMGGAKPVKNAADSSDFDDLTTPEDESEESDLDVDNIPDQKPPEAETGGIVSGPDSGYLAKLHGDEMVVPLDNNYTQGEPSAMDGKVRPVPETSAITSKPQSFEQGTSNLGSKVGFTKLNLGMASKSSSDSDAMSQPLMDAMSLPMMVAGGTVLSSVTNLMNQLGPESDSFAGEIAKVARPIADVFGLPTSLANKVTGQKSSKGDSDTKNKDKTEAKKKGFFSNLFEKLKKVSGGAGGGGGGGGGPSTTNGGGAKTGAGSMSAGGEEGLGNFIGSKESGNSYTKLVGGAEDASILDKTVRQLNSEKGGQFAMGKYQIQMRTASEVLRNAGKDPDKFKFDQQGQDEIFKLLLERRGVDDYISGKISEDEFALNLSKEWAALPMNASGSGYYDGDGKNKSLVSYEETIKMIRGLKESAEVPSTPPTAQIITQNFGVKTGEKIYFTHEGSRFNAYKTTNGFEIFKGMTRIDTSGGKNAAVLKSFIKEGKKRSGISSPTSSETPGQTQAALQKPNKNTGASGATQVAMLNTSAAQKSAGTDKPPTPEQTVVREGDTNDLTSMFASPLVG